MRLKRTILLLFLVITVLNGTAQVFRSKRDKLFRLISDTLVLDSLSLVPGSLVFTTFPAGDSSLGPVFHPELHALVFGKKKPDSIRVTYAVFPFNFEKNRFHKDPSLIYSDLSRPINPFVITYSNSTARENLFQNDGLNKNGSISRGISFGNNQDVVVNSNLNLQVNGKLTPEIDMVLAATDNNIPFQADGTTAQLQEFDKVFIQLNNKSTKMIVGDYQLSRPANSYFMNFYKRSQGLYLENTYTDSALKNPLSFKTRISGAVSRGKFSRQVFFGTENNQGPYRLRGADNEPFIIVLSGTEKIYIDGKLLQRGQEHDYIIDYNSGELTFTAKQIITKDKRIVAEFQYAERNYARSLFHFGEEISAKKSKVFVNVFSEQDNKNRPLQQVLDQPQKNILIAIGDTLEKALYTGVEEAAFNNSDVFYKRMDTVVNGILYNNIYVYSVNSDSAKFRLKFTNVGSGKGNYNQVTSAANGKVYQWVAPIAGVPAGSYEPVIPLVTPKQNQMVTGGFSHSITATNEFGLEGAYTNNDINRFSAADKGNDEGSALKVYTRNKTALRNSETAKELNMVYNGSFEFVQQRFKQVERFRSVEFERDWNRPLSAEIRNDQSIANVQLGLMNKGSRSVIYALDMFTEGESFEAMRHSVNSQFGHKGFSSAYQGSYLNSSDQLLNQASQFYRHKSSVSQKISKVRLGFADEFENNLLMNRNDLTLQPRAYRFWEWEGSVSNADSSKNKVKVFYRERRDKLNYNNTLLDSTLARNIGLNTSIYSIRNNPLSLIFTYRELETKNVVGTSLRPDNAVLSRLEYNPKYFKGFITAGLFYETGYGLENRKEFYYLEVAPGQGQYTWIDYNANSIKELNEFEIAQFSDQARFIRIYTPTNKYVKVLQNLFSISANIRPSVLIRSKSNNLAGFVKRWTFQTAFRADNKTMDRKDIGVYNPLMNAGDSILIASTRNWRQSVFFNQSSAIFSADYTFVDNQSKQLLLNGFEERTLYSHEIHARFNFTKAWSINTRSLYSRKGNMSQFFSSRNYLIESYETEQRLAFQPNTIFRISGIYKYSERENILTGASQNAIIQDFAVELKYNQSEKGSFLMRGDFIRNQYKGESNSAITYEILNALNNGDNFTWELNYQRNLGSNLQISFNYNGRKTPGTNVVHIGGAQVRALF